MTKNYKTGVLYAFTMFYGLLQNYLTNIKFNVLKYLCSFLSQKDNFKGYSILDDSNIFKSA